MQLCTLTPHILLSYTYFSSPLISFCYSIILYTPFPSPGPPHLLHPRPLPLVLPSGPRPYLPSSPRPAWLIRGTRAPKWTTYSLCHTGDGGVLASWPPDAASVLALLLPPRRPLRTDSLRHPLSYHRISRVCGSRRRFLCDQVNCQ